MIDLMIADDNSVFAEQLSCMLTREKDFRVVSITHNGIQTLMDYSALKPDVLLLDLKMPNFDGFQVLDSLSQDSKEKEKQNIIVISGDINSRASLHNMEKVRWMIDKDFNVETLFNVIREIKVDSEYDDISKTIDDLMNTLKFDSCHKGTALIKEGIYIAFTQPMICNRIDDLINILAYRFNYSSSKSARSTMDKCIAQMLKQHKNHQIFYDTFEDFYGYSISVKYLIKYCVRYLENVYK